MGGDLHCHTKLSDGSLGIEDLITLAKKREVGTIAITDHDCLAGTVRGKIIGDRFGLWARDDVVFKKETDVNINHSPYVYIAKACSGATSPSVDELVKFYFEWQEIKFAPTAEGNIIAFPTAWIKKA